MIKSQWLFFATFVLIYNLSHAQNYTFDTVPIQISTQPRIHLNYDKPGYYQMALSANKTELNPGDTFDVSLYFTGYGEIGESKISLYPSQADIFNSNSFLIAGLGRDQNGNLYWGTRNVPFNHGEWTVTMGGMLYDTTVGNRHTTYNLGYYLDASRASNSLLILTEKYLRRAPVTMNMKLKNNIAPGNYNISFYYTYYNGSEWQGSTQQIAFKVNNLAEQYSVPIAIGGFVFAFFGILPIILPLIIEGYKKLFNLKKTKSMMVNNTISTTPNVSIQAALSTTQSPKKPRITK